MALTGALSIKSPVRRVRGPIGEIAAAPGGTELAIQLIGECSATASDLPELA
jgi:hypothetical protein